jgi:hypothetical protein
MQLGKLHTKRLSDASGKMIATAGYGTSRRFAAVPEFGRYWSKSGHRVRTAGGSMRR